MDAYAQRSPADFANFELSDGRQNISLAGAL